MSTKILLADDSITIQKVIGIIFGGEEYALTVVDNGKAALEKALETDPDILLIDALMPGMSGYDVCERVRATPQLATKPILLLTGSFEPFDETKARNVGADDFIAKPFESQQIIAKVTELCQRSVFRAETAPRPTPTPPPPAEIAFPADEAALSSEVTPSSIWDAFAPAEPPAEVSPAPFAEPERNVAATEESATVASPWSPIDEKSFTFEEESAADAPPVSFYEPVQGDEVSPGESPFTPHPEPHAQPVELQIEPPIMETAVPTADISPAAESPAGTALTEEQLKTAIAGASRDIIERIVWEVVPDLAESMIREAIRRITEGRA